METQEIKYIDSDNEVCYILSNSKGISMLNHPEILKSYKDLINNENT